MLHLVREAVLITALAPLAYYILAIFCTLHYFPNNRPTRPSNSELTPPVSILKPVRGLDREAYENFASFCRQDYPQYEILFAVSDPDDPVIAVIEKLRRDFPERSIRLVTNVPSLGASPKLNNLCGLAREAKYDLLVISDSDVRVAPNYLRDATAPFADPQVGLVTSFFRGKADGSFAAKLEGLAISTETLPSALLARYLEGQIRFAFGWTMATTKRNLAAIGGFEAMVNYHSDDFELGRRIAAKGFRIKLMRNPVSVVFPRESFGDYLRHEMRWAIGLRNVRPAGYLGLILTFGLPWALLAAAFSHPFWMGAAYLLSYLLLRLGQVWVAGVWALQDSLTRKSLWLVPLRDAVSFLTWLAGFFTSKITWRGLEYRVKGGRLFPVVNTKGAGAEV